MLFPTLLHRLSALVFIWVLFLRVIFWSEHGLCWCSFQYTTYFGLEARTTKTSFEKMNKSGLNLKCFWFHSMQKSRHLQWCGFTLYFYLVINISRIGGFLIKKDQLSHSNFLFLYLQQVSSTHWAESQPMSSFIIKVLSTNFSVIGLILSECTLISGRSTLLVTINTSVRLKIL